MYSYEDRIRAVKLYISLGMRIRATIRQLGYPTKNALLAWHREYVRDSDLTKGYIRSTRKYSPSQRERAVQYYLDHDQCIAATLKALGYPCRGKGSLTECPLNLDHVRVRLTNHQMRSP